MEKEKLDDLLTKKYEEQQEKKVSGFRPIKLALTGLAAAGLIWYAANKFSGQKDYDFSGTLNIDYQTLEMVSNENSEKGAYAKSFLNYIKSRGFDSTATIYKNDDIVQLDDGNKVKKVRVGENDRNSLEYVYSKQPKPKKGSRHFNPEALERMLPYAIMHRIIFH